MNDLPLDGCRSIPLAAYLKALGVLRLVAEQRDPVVRGWWNGDRFHLRTDLGRDDLVRFFLNDYRPTPIIAPWNGGSGFYPKDAKAGISALQASTPGRFAAYREVIDLGARLIRERNLGERPTDQAKGELISALRAEAGAALAGWIDAAVTLTLDKVVFPPLLGTGGNDGRLDFTNNFMQRLAELIPTDGGQPGSDAAAALNDALFATPAAGLSSAAIGQFAPGAAGGPNSTAGFQGDPLVNRWDFVLMLEGTLVFAGGVSRRLEGADAAYLSYPFTVRAAAAGYGSASADEQTDSRGELWAPLWKRPAGYPEVRALFREGRLSLGARPARDGLDAARAVGGLGTDRGIASFERYGFVKRQGLAYLAASLGRRRVEPNPRSDLINEFDRNNWLERLRSRAASDEATAELRKAARTLDDGIFALLEQPENRRTIQDMLGAVGATARAIALRPKLQETLWPPPLLSKRWIEAADDGSPEFRLAVALAGMRARLETSRVDEGTAPEDAGMARGSGYGLPMRAHLAPLDPDTVMWAPAWALKQPKAAEGRAVTVWSAGKLVDNLCAIAQRRLLEQTRHGWSEVPFGTSFDGEQNTAVAVGGGEIVAFLDGEVRDERIAELLLGLSWVEPGRWSGERHAEPLPFVYTALKPLFTPRSILEWLKDRGWLKGDVPDLPIPPALPSLLTAGRIQQAVQLAQERARASGLPTPFLQQGASFGRTADANFGRRLLAALVVPVHASVVGACLKQTYSDSDEESPDAA